MLQANQPKSPLVTTRRMSRRIFIPWQQGESNMSRTRTSRWGAVFTVALVLCLLVLSGCRPAATSSDLDRVKQDGVLTVGNDTTYAPFEFADSTNKPTGFDIDLIAAVAEKLGLKTDIVTTAWDGIIPALQTQKFEVVISSMTITPDREKEVSFSIPYYRADMGIVFDKTLHTIATPSDLAGLRVGAQVGTTGEQSAHMIDGVTDVRSYPDIQLAMADLKLARIDAVVNDFPVCAYYAKDSPTLTVIRILKVKDLDLTQYYGIAMRLEDKQLKIAVDKALQDLVKDGTYDTIYAKWFGGTPGFRPGDQKP
ncbi:basic amino acid ABC transporter substrate-binding protein [Candidatus Cryosericum septentrionale]|uniref:Basic amino acid ABC transporter substrate-binding protein n=2 Tax=Candidatus Cryosericum septentrionale TaxID=2290913 RepID=A0A398DPR7_9BACT|nr:basic amino acid ABC transporter substrate-binding protein [Candidatus Cryosericum septentrionale]